MWSIRRRPPLRYYAYISDRKVDQLHADRVRRRIRDLLAIRATAKVREQNAELTVEAALRDPTPMRERYDRLYAVERAIRREITGTVQSPAPFFRGSMSMMFGRFRGGDPDDSGVAFWVG